MYNLQKTDLEQKNCVHTNIWYSLNPSARLSTTLPQEKATHFFSLRTEAKCFRGGSWKSRGREKAEVNTLSFEAGGLICHSHGSQPGSNHIPCQLITQKRRLGVVQTPRKSGNNDRTRTLCCSILEASAGPLACPTVVLHDPLAFVPCAPHDRFHLTL